MTDKPYRLSDLDLPPPEVPIVAPYIPAAEFTLLSGDPDSGKSWLAGLVTQSLTTGQPTPFEVDEGGSQQTLDEGGPLTADEPGPRSPATVVYASREQDPRCLHGRLRLLGADLARVCVVPFVPVEEVERYAEWISAYRPTLIVLDPVDEYLPGTNSSTAVRRVLGPFLCLCREEGVATLGIRHRRKGRSGNALYSGLGSIALTAMARSELLLGRDPRDKDRIVLIQIKNNLALCGPSQEFSIGKRGMEWVGVSTLTAENLNEKKRNERGATALEIAVSFLLSELHDGPRPAGELLSLARRKKIAHRTLKRAKKRLGVRTTKSHDDTDNKITRWFWEFPHEPEIAAKPKTPRWQITPDAVHEPKADVPSGDVGEDCDGDGGDGNAPGDDVRSDAGGDDAAGGAGSDGANPHGDDDDVPGDPRWN